MVVLSRWLLLGALVSGCDPLVDGLADPAPEVLDPRVARSLYADCVDTLSAQGAPTCLVLDDYRSLLLLTPDGKQRCDLRLSLDRESRSRMAWVGHNLYLCTREGLERMNLHDGRREVLGARCQGAVELDGEALVFEDAARLLPLEAILTTTTATAREPISDSPGVELWTSPWPGLITGWGGALDFSVQPRTLELFGIDLASRERRLTSLPEVVSIAGGLERIGPHTMIGLEHTGPGQARWLTIEGADRLEVTVMPTASRLFDPQLVDCRTSDDGS